MKTQRTTCADCGHPRSEHINCSGTYPALCIHEEHDGVCWCLDFSEDSVAIYGELVFVPTTQHDKAAA